MRNRCDVWWRAPRGRLNGRHGQSILEYLVIATIIVGAIIVIAKPAITTHMNSLYTNAAQKTGDAATALGGLKVEQ